MKKALLVTIDYPPNIGGVASYWKRVTDSLPGSIDVLADTDNRKLFYKFFWPKWIKGIFRIYNEVKSKKYTSIIVGQLLPVGSMVYFLNRFFKIPYIVQLYGMDIKQASTTPRKRKLAIAILKGAKHIVSNSKSTSNELAKLVKLDNVTEIYPLPNSSKPVSKEILKAFEEKYAVKGKKVLLSVGRLVERKGIDNAIKAFKELNKNVCYPGSSLNMNDEPANICDSMFIITSTGPYEDELKRLAGDTPNIIFTGRLSDEEIQALYQLCTAFIMVSRSKPNDVEGFGMVYIEANLHKKAVIAGNQGGAIEAVENGVSGIVVDPNSIREISEAIERLFNNPEYAKQLGEQGYKRIQREFDWDESMKKLYELL